MIASCVHGVYKHFWVFAEPFACLRQPDSLLKCKCSNRICKCLPWHLGGVCLLETLCTLKMGHWQVVWPEPPLFYGVNPVESFPKREVSKMLLPEPLPPSPVFWLEGQHAHLPTAVLWQWFLYLEHGFIAVIWVQLWGQCRGGIKEKNWCSKTGTPDPATSVTLETGMRNHSTLKSKWWERWWFEKKMHLDVSCF